MRRSLTLLACTFSLSVAACNTPITQPDFEVPAAAPGCPAVGEQCFGQPEDAPMGKSRVYVFRPDFSALGKEDAPTLMVDDSIEVTITRLTYAPLDLEIGKHRFVVVPDPNDSQNWNLSGVLDLTAAGRYYLAIWNSDVAFRKDSGTAGQAIKQGAASAAVGVATAAATGGLAIYPLYLPNPPKWKATKSEARFEVIEEKDALEYIRQCTLSAPRNRRPAEADGTAP